jgi:hypothetical protein
MGRSPEAFSLIDVILNNQTVNNNPHLVKRILDYRMHYHRTHGNVLGGRQTADSWEERKFMDADSLLQASRYRAITAAMCASRGDKKTKDLEVDGAMKWLQAAISAGYRNVDQLKKDHDFRIVIEQERAQQLIKSIR